MQPKNVELVTAPGQANTISFNLLKLRAISRENIAKNVEAGSKVNETKDMPEGISTQQNVDITVGVNVTKNDEGKAYKLVWIPFVEVQISGNKPIKLPAQMATVFFANAMSLMGALDKNLPELKEIVPEADVIAEPVAAPETPVLLPDYPFVSKGGTPAKIEQYNVLEPPMEEEAQVRDIPVIPFDMNFESLSALPKTVEDISQPVQVDNNSEPNLSIVGVNLSALYELKRKLAELQKQQSEAAVELETSKLAAQKADDSARNAKDELEMVVKVEGEKMQQELEAAQKALEEMTAQISAYRTSKDASEKAQQRWEEAVNTLRSR